MRLATRLALATAALLVAALGLALAFATSRANEVTRRKIEQNLKAVPAIYRSFERAEASARRQQVRSLAEQPGTKALLAEAGASRETTHDSAVEFAASLGAGVVFLFDSRGSLLARSDRGVGEGAGRDFSAVAWVKEPLRGAEASAYILEVSRGKALMLVASAPVVQGAGREQILNGVIAAGFPIDDQRAGEVGSLMTGEAAFLGNVGGRAGPARAEVVAATPRLKAVGFHDVLAAAAALDPLLGRGQAAGPFEFRAGGDVYVATALPILSGGGEPIAALVVARSKDVELQPFRQIRRGIVWTGLAVLLISLPASVALARRVSQPIVQLARGAEAIRGGQLDIVLPHARGDEVGTLARAFAAMVAELKQKAALEEWVAEILRRPGDVTQAARLGPVAEADAGLEVGKLFARRYHVLSVLGQGGMGTVYRVQDRELDEEVALKVLLTDSFGPETEAVEVLRQETRLARMITHPNVVRVFDLGESEGTYFLTMEYVPGTTLTELLERRGPLDLAPGLQIAKQVCRGLAAVHRAGVIHGDLKPRNVMVMASGVVKLMDFGVARGTRLGQKQEGVMGGSVHYMSPEQARGAELDPQSDLYSAGVTFFEMFTGSRPFESDDREELRRTHLYEPPPDPRTRRSDLPDLLAQVILACLEKTRVKRPATAADLERALLRVRV
jgi:serine/threonine-protein kinase